MAGAPEVSREHVEPLKVGVREGAPRKAVPIGRVVENVRELTTQEVALCIWEDETLSDEERAVVLRYLGPRSELN